MDGNDGLGAWGNDRFHLGDIHTESIGTHIDENRLQPKEGDYLNGGHKGKWHGDDLVTGLEAEGHQGELQGVGAAGTGDHVSGTRVRG